MFPWSLGIDVWRFGAAVLRQGRPRARAHGNLIAAIDGAVDIHVGTEVRRGRGLTGAAARLDSVAGVDKAVAAGSADEQEANVDGRVGKEATTKFDVAQRNGYALTISYTNQVLSYRIAKGTACTPAGDTAQSRGVRLRWRR